MVELEHVKTAQNAACNDPSQRSTRTGDTCVVYSDSMKKKCEEAKQAKHLICIKL